MGLTFNSIQFNYVSAGGIAYIQEFNTATSFTCLTALMLYTGLFLIS